MGSEYRWTIEAMDPDHWLATAFPYWEGPVIAAGSNPGIGYLELTGYQ
jgi:predicted secreted hydrolase